jgi:hypothetical protein
LGNKTLEEVFTGKKLGVSHLKIFGCLVYIHVPTEKRTKLEPSRKKGTFVGYSETSKAYRIYIPEQRYIENSRDVTFDEEAAFKKSRESHMDEDREKQEAPKDAVMIDSTPKEYIPEDQNETVELEIPVDPPREVTVTKQRPAWLQNTLQEAEKHAAPSGSFRESKKPCKFSNYVALMSKIIDSKPSTYEEVSKQRVEGCYDGRISIHHEE